MGLGSPQRGAGQLLYRNNPNHQLVDSLPFVDTVPVDLEPRVRELVQAEMALILHESGASEPELLQRYLSPLDFKLAHNDMLYNKEIDRIKNGVEMTKLDLDKYSSLGDEKDPKLRLKRAKVLLEFSQASLVNLELMDRYKEGSWLKYLDSLTLLKLRMDRQKARLDSRLEELNKRRKLAQIEAANRLRAVNQECDEYRARNAQLLLTIQQVQQDAKVTYDGP